MEGERMSQRILYSEITKYKTSGKTKKKNGGLHLEGHITDLSYLRMEKNRRQRRMGVSF
jgi:hypothetical protein